MLAGAVGDLAEKNKWPEGSPQKLALHGLAGAIAAKVGDGSVAAGAGGAMLQEKLAPVLANYLVENGYDFTERGISEEEAKRRFAAYDGLMKLGMTLAGTALGAAAGGANPAQTAASAAGAAWTGVTYNYLNHVEAKNMAALKDAALQGKCGPECQTEIRRLEKLDQGRNAELQACVGVASESCDKARQEVRKAAADYIRAEDSARMGGYYASGLLNLKYFLRFVMEVRFQGGRLLNCLVSRQESLFVSKGTPMGFRLRF